MSDWNRYLDRKLALDLTVEEHRLADALARSLLGFRQLADRLGEGLLRERARLHGRSFERARAGLVEKGLIQFTPPESTGRGHRTLYELLLGETPAEEREIPETPAPEREFSEEAPPQSGSLSAQTPAETPAETPALERGRIEERGEEEQEPAAVPPAHARDGGGADLEPEPFTEAVALLGLTAGQRELARRAFDEDEHGFLRVVQEARLSGRAPAALLVSKLSRGEHRGKAGRLGVTIEEVVGDADLSSAPLPPLPEGWLRNPPLGECFGCGKETTLVDAIRCADCTRPDEEAALAETAELVADGVLEER